MSMCGAHTLELPLWWHPPMSLDVLDDSKGENPLGVALHVRDNLMKYRDRMPAEHVRRMEAWIEELETPKP